MIRRQKVRVRGRKSVWSKEEMGTPKAARGERERNDSARLFERVRDHVIPKTEKKIEGFQE